MNAETAYRRYFPLVRSRCRRLLGDGPLAGDVAQETFVRFLGANISGTDERIVRWLYVCSGNLSIDQLRKRRTPVSVEDLAPSPVAPHAETAAAVRSLVKRLGEQVGTEVLHAALLTHVEGLSQVEIAQVLGVSERTVRRWLATVEAAVKALEAEPEVTS